MSGVPCAFSGFSPQLFATTPSLASTFQMQVYKGFSVRQATIEVIGCQNSVRSDYCMTNLYSLYCAIHDDITVDKIPVPASN